MNREQTSTLIAYLNRANIIPALEGQTAVWHDALADIDYSAAQEAVRELAKSRLSTDRWLTPGDIRAATRLVITNRVVEHRRNYPQILPPAELAESPEAEREWKARYWDAVRAGLDHETAETAANGVLT